MNNIFISYRREDAADVTGRINDRLREHYGKELIFTDVDNIPFGVDFRTKLDEEVSQCKVLLAVIGRNWLSVKNDKGQRRLDDPADFVRIEIESALQRNIPVVPLLVHGTEMPSADKLPKSLQQLIFRNGTPIRPDPDFHKDMDRLINGLDVHLRTYEEEEKRQKTIVEQRKEEEPVQEVQDDEKVFDDEIRKILNIERGAISDKDYQGITELDLEDMGLKTLPPKIGKLTNLLSLVLMNNELTDLPEAIGRLTNLQELDLSGSQLTDLPEAIAKLTNLQSLNLEGNELTALPEAITKMTNLQSLDLFGNKLTALPEAIAKLTNLQELDLSATELTDLPEPIVKMTNLQNLRLYSNQLTTLPEAITKLTNLKKLYLKSNNFSEEEKDRIRSLLPNCDISF